MINRYPLWKNLLVFIVICLGVVYALPNIYLPDYAVQVSPEETTEVVSQAGVDAALTLRSPQDKIEDEGECHQNKDVGA